MGMYVALALYCTQMALSLRRKGPLFLFFFFTIFAPEYMSCFFEKLADLESDCDSLYLPASGAYE